MLVQFAKRSSRQCPVTAFSHTWLEKKFPFLVQRFGEEEIRNKKILVPNHTDFPVRYDGSDTSAWDTLQILAARMGISSSCIALDIYKGERTRVVCGLSDNPPSEKDIPQKAIDGKYHIGLEKKMLTDPQGLVAWLAHDLARILLIEHPQPEQGKRLADLCTVVQGLGIFNANVSYRETHTATTWGYERIGYLKPREWGYALALFAQLREEKDPAWAKHLTPNIRSDFAKSQKYLEGTA
jgi:hypothetical protein